MCLWNNGRHEMIYLHAGDRFCPPSKLHSISSPSLHIKKLFCLYTKKKNMINLSWAWWEKRKTQAWIEKVMIALTGCKQEQRVAKTWSIPPIEDLKLDKWFPQTCQKQCMLKFCFLSIENHWRWSFTLFIQYSKTLDLMGGLAQFRRTQGWQ